VVQQAPALGDQLQESATRVIVLLVRLEVLGEVRDAFGQIATCTSAEPVSCSPRAWVWISSALRSAVIDIGVSVSKVEHAGRAKLPGAHLADRDRSTPMRSQNGA